MSADVYIPLQSGGQKTGCVVYFDLRDCLICHAVAAFPQGKQIADVGFCQAGVEGLDLRRNQRFAVDENAPAPSERLLPMQGHAFGGIKTGKGNKCAHGGEETEERAAIRAGARRQVGVEIFGAHGQSSRAEAT